MAVLTGLALAAVAPYVAGVLVPYFVNGLHQLPLSEVAGGAHDPKDLWPQGTLGGLIQLGGFLSLALTPMALVCVSIGSGIAAAVSVPRSDPGRASWGVVVALAVLTIACAAATVWMFGPTAAALATWRLD